VSCAALAPVVRLGERVGLQRLVGQQVDLSKPGRVNAHLKISCLVAGMVAGADSIDDIALLRHTARWAGCSPGCGRPQRWGRSCARSPSGHVRQLYAVASRLLINLAGEAPLLPGADELAYLDVDDTLRQTYG
jgi:hypothetical protein